MEGDEPDETELVYLTFPDVLDLYALIIRTTTSEAVDHLRNRDGLQSALARPETYAHYQAADLALQATVLTHSIAGTNRLSTATSVQPFCGDADLPRDERTSGCGVRPELADWINQLQRRGDTRGCRRAPSSVVQHRIG